MARNSHTRTSRPGRIGPLQAPALVGIAVLAACITEVPPPSQTIWQTNLTGAIEYPDATGSAASISSGGATQVSISVAGIAGGTYGWGVYRGSCAAPGSLLGEATDYPPLEVDLHVGEAEAQVQRAMNSTSTFFAQVMTEDGTRVACGDFLLW